MIHCSLLVVLPSSESNCLYEQTIKFQVDHLKLVEAWFHALLGWDTGFTLYPTVNQSILGCSIYSQGIIDPLGFQWKDWGCFQGSVPGQDLNYSLLFLLHWTVAGITAQFFQTSICCFPFGASLEQSQRQPRLWGENVPLSHNVASPSSHPSISSHDGSPIILGNEGALFCLHSIHTTESKLREKCGSLPWDQFPPVSACF